MDQLEKFKRNLEKRDLRKLSFPAILEELRSASFVQGMAKVKKDFILNGEEKKRIEEVYQLAKKRANEAQLQIIENWS